MTETHMVNVKGEPADGVAGDDHDEHFDHLLKRLIQTKMNL